MLTATIRSALILACAACGACTPGIGTQVRYEIGLPPNISLSAQSDAGQDAFRRLDVELHISEVQPDCSLGFLGSLSVSIWDSHAFALKPGRIHYVVIVLEGGKLRGGNYTRNIALMIDPRTDFSYRLVLDYSDDTYSVQLFERASGGGERPIPHEPRACEPEV